MTEVDFVDSIKKVVYSSAASGVVEQLKKPAGRRPAPEVIELSQWFHSLNEIDRAKIAQVANMAADQATYNFLLVLDGLLAIELTGTKGRLDLIVERENSRTLLNNSEAVPLSVLYKED